MNDLELIVIAENIRSIHNVGALFRLCDGLGVKEIILCGYTPLPAHPNDSRLPHLAEKIDKAISKTGLGAEKRLPWRHFETAVGAIEQLRTSGYKIIALEQAPGKSQPLESVATLPGNNLAIIIGNEVTGVEAETLSHCDHIFEIEMLGKKESHNVITASAICLYHLRLAKNGIIHKQDL